MIYEIGGLKWDVREGTTDWNTINACCGEDEYHLRDVDVAGKTVIDFGAHVGGVAVWLASRGATVIAVEPLAENCAAIQQNALLNGVSPRIVQAAAGISGEETTIAYGFHGDRQQEEHGFIGNIVGLRGRWPGEQCDYVTVPTVNWPDFPHADIAKIDCEGGEWPLLAHPLVADVNLIVGEWHPWEGNAKDDVTRFLGSSHEVTFEGPEGGPGNFRALKIAL